MYNKIKGGSSMVIGEGDLAITVHLPPEGMVWNYETNKLEPCEVIVRSMIKADQYWERPEPPKDYTKRVAKEKDIRKIDPSYFDNELQKYRAREWHRRKFGVWFMNNGKMTYLTGLHYFYLTHWKIDVGYPEFRYADLKKSYFMQYCMEDPKSYGMIEVTRRRAGKCFGKGTKIRMYDGAIKNVEEIHDGDLVMGDDSTPRKVYGVVSGEEEMFLITPNKGDSWTCNRSHILTTKWCLNRDHKKRGWKAKSVVNISVDDYLKLDSWEKRHLVLYRKGVEYKEVNHVVDPYFLGLWLGDGSSQNISVTSVDNEVISYVKDVGERFGLNYKNSGILHSISCSRSKKISKTVGEYEFSFPTEVDYKDFYRSGRPNSSWSVIDGTQNIVLNEFKKVGLINNKHIPKEYMIDSCENRLLLLAGIIDTDGHLTISNNKPTRYSVTQTRESLAIQIKDLAISLGFYASLIKFQSSMKRSDGTVYKGDAFMVNIFGDLHRIPCRIKRKRAENVSFHLNRKSPEHTGFTVSSIGFGEYYGFAVDKNHLFLLHDGTVVHNSYYSGCFLTEFTTRTPNANGGIQSKTEMDAKSFFSRAVVQPFRKLIDFFKPEYDTSQGDVPKKELRFYKSSKKGKQESIDYDQTAEMESMVTFRNSKPEAYDGEKLMVYVADEEFKVGPELNILERHRIVKPCLEDSSGSIIGKAIYTSTVEEMEGAMEDYIQLWEDSDFTKRMSNGQTKSGLYRFFTPAQDMMYINKYGIPDSQKGLEELLSMRKDLSDDPRALSSYIRKYPTNWKEAFRSTGDDCIYNSIKLDERLDTLNWKKDNYERFDLIFEDEEKTKVKLSKNSTGRFKFSKAFLEQYDYSSISNNVLQRGTNFLPKNILRFVVGIDPFDHNRTKDGRFSNGAAAVYMKYDTEYTEVSDNFVCIYVARPQTAQIFWEDMVKLCHFFGCQMLFEDQKIGIRHYFHDRGYGAFIMKDDKGNEGISASEKSHQSLVEHTELFIDENCHKVNFPELLEDWKKFKIDDTQKFDLSMASGYALIAAARIKKKQNILQKRSKISPQFQRRYRLTRNEKRISKSLH